MIGAGKQGRERQYLTPAVELKLPDPTSLATLPLVAAHKLSPLLTFSAISWTNVAGKVETALGTGHSWRGGVPRNTSASQPEDKMVEAVPSWQYCETAIRMGIS
jgi:hypothetical protein